MTDAEALFAARAAALQRNFVLTNHARVRMQQRGIQVGDVANALDSATAASCGPNGNWKLTGGRDLEDDELVVVVSFNPDTKIVTVY